MNPSELSDPGFMEGSAPMSSTSFSTSQMMNTCVPNQANQSQNYANTLWFASGSGMQSQQTNQPQFNHVYPIQSDIGYIPSAPLISSQQPSQPQLNEAYQSQNDQANSLQSTSGAGMHSQQTNQPQFNQVYPIQSDIGYIASTQFISSQQTSQPQLNEAYQSQTDQANSLQSTSGAGGHFQQTNQPQFNQVYPIQSDIGYIASTQFISSQQTSQPQLNEAYQSQTDQANSLQSTSGAGMHFQQTNQPQFNQVCPIQSDIGYIASTQFISSQQTSQPQLNEAYQSQIDQANSLQSTSGAGMHFQQTNQPQFNQVCPIKSDIGYIASTQFISSQQTSQPQLNEAYQSQTDQANSLQSTSGKTLSKDKKEKSQRAKTDEKYRNKQKELKKCGIKLFEFMEQNGLLPAQASHSKIQQTHHPSFSAPEASFPRDRHGTNSGEVEPINLEVILALRKERDRLANDRKRCIKKASTSSPQPNTPLSAQFNGSQTSNDIQDPHRRISSSSGGIASCSHITENEENSRAGTSTPMVELLMKIDENRKSNVDFSDFTGLHLEHGERVRVGRYSFPKSLKCTVEKIIDEYGDVTKNSEMPISVDERTYILFCATIKDMDDHQLEEVTKETILKWSDAIKDALRIKFNVEFAMNHLKDNIVPAYIGRIECQEVNNMDIKISKLEAELNASREERDKRHKQSMVYNDSIKKFNDKSMSTGLFK
ncbi:hypothetical protein REPUB_Repub11eG0045600 [Reevesia pubescens]